MLLFENSHISSNALFIQATHAKIWSSDELKKNSISASL